MSCMHIKQIWPWCEYLITSLEKNYVTCLHKMAFNLNVFYMHCWWRKILGIGGGGTWRNHFTLNPIITSNGGGGWGREEGGRGRGACAPSWCPPCFHHLCLTSLSMRMDLRVDSYNAVGYIRTFSYINNYNQRYKVGI